MKHIMSLFEESYNQIRDNTKKIEIRCNDEKRQNIKVGDEIIFYKLPEKKEKIKVKVLELYQCKTFEELYYRFDFSEFGCEGYTMKKMIDETKEIYSEEQERKYGAVGIRIELI